MEQQGAARAASCWPQKSRLENVTRTLLPVTFFLDGMDAGVRTLRSEAFAT